MHTTWYIYSFSIFCAFTITPSISYIYKVVPKNLEITNKSPSHAEHLTSLIKSLTSINYGKLCPSAENSQGTAQ